MIKNIPIFWLINPNFESQLSHTFLLHLSISWITQTYESVTGVPSRTFYKIKESPPNHLDFFFQQIHIEHVLSANGRYLEMNMILPSLNLKVFCWKNLHTNDYNTMYLYVIHVVYNPKVPVRKSPKSLEKVLWRL